MPTYSGDQRAAGAQPRLREPVSSSDARRSIFFRAGPILITCFLYSPYEEKIRRDQNAGRSIVEANQFVEAEIPKVDLLWHMHCCPLFASNKKEICA